MGALQRARVRAARVEEVDDRDLAQQGRAPDGPSAALHEREVGDGPVHFEALSVHVAQPPPCRDGNGGEHQRGDRQPEETETASREAPRPSRLEDPDLHVRSSPLMNSSCKPEDDKTGDYPPPVTPRTVRSSNAVIESAFVHRPTRPDRNRVSRAISKSVPLSQACMRSPTVTARIVCQRPSAGALMLVCAIWRRPRS